MLTESAVHAVDTAFFLSDVRMHIQVEGCCDVRMTEDSAHGLVVALAFDAPGGKRVAQAMEDDVRYTKAMKQTREIFAVCARVGGLCAVAL